MFIIKTKGTGNLPDNVQIKDEDFLPVDNFNINHALNCLEDYRYENNDIELLKLLHDIPYESLTEFNL
ncbi:MAG: hypothetical protein HY738_02815 [Bacteroidia bacterium]|nr:hypothetical protein [Bacteroidia bacterium]